MAGLASERCFHHETREAVCRCPVCRRFFCRECVVPFDGRLLCATCIAEANQPDVVPEKVSSHPGQMLLGTAALILIWAVFYCLGWFVLQYRETLPVTVTEQRHRDSNAEARALVGVKNWAIAQQPNHLPSRAREQAGLLSKPFSAPFWSAADKFVVRSPFVAPRE